MAKAKSRDGQRHTYEREDGAVLTVYADSPADQRLARAVKAGEAKRVQSAS